MKTITDTKEPTDTERLDWLDSGNCVIALTSGFSANFERQNWTTHKTARAAIDAAIRAEKGTTT